MKHPILVVTALALLGSAGGAHAREPAYKVDFGKASARPVPLPVAPSARGEPSVEVVRVPEKPAAAFVLKGGQAPVAVNVDDVPVLTPGQVLLSKSLPLPQPRVARTDPGALHLPYEARYVAESGELRTIDIIAKIAGEGLRIIGDATAFSTEVFVMLEDRAAPNSGGELPQAVEILATGPFDKVDPVPLAIKTLGTWHKIALFVADPPEAARVNLHARVDRDGLDLSVPVRRPRLSLSISPPLLQGFGLESATVTVRAEGLPRPSGRDVVLHTTGGHLEQSRVTLDANGIGTLGLRSGGVGSATITATSPPLSAASPITVPYRWPLRFLAFALAGGAVGAFISMTRKRKSKRAKIPWLELVAGVLLGLLVAVCAALGVNLTGIELPTLAADVSIFFLAGAGALGLAGPLSLKLPGQADKATQ